MPPVDLTVEICGMAGDGTIAAGGILNDAMAEAGFSVLGFDSYPAEIRGFGRCVTRSRFGERKPPALEDSTHVLISLNDKESRSRVPNLVSDAGVLFDNKPPSYVREIDSLTAILDPGAKLYGIPFSDLSTQSSGMDRNRNLVALGGFSAVYGVPPVHFHEAVRKRFKAKGDQVLRSVLRSFDAGFQYVLSELSDRLPGPLPLPDGKNVREVIMISGSTAVAEGALDAGLHAYFGYPITPATPIMEHLAKILPRRGGRVVQMEDEIASIGAVLGCFFAGKRAMTATSGPGFALMTELITHGVMSETPAVIVNAQRGGPATGLPTKTEQSDLLAAVFGGPGDSYRIVLAPTDVSECYEFTRKSFRLAEKYQTPVIILTDFYLNNRVESIPKPVPNPACLADANRYPDSASKNRYHRFQITESGISPRALPGMEGFAFTATGLEHSEAGLPDYTPENHQKMSDKRRAKIRSALEELPPPEEFESSGSMEIGVIGWGSTFGSILEAVQRARSEGISAGALKIGSLWPLHEEAIRDFVRRCRIVCVAELNQGAQLAQLLGPLSDKEIHRLNRATGMPITPSWIQQGIVRLAGEL